MDGLGGYGSSSDEDAPVPAVSAEADRLEQRARKKEKKERKKEKERKKAAAAAVASVPVSLDAPLPSLKFALPSADELLAAGAATPTFLHLHTADQLRAAAEARAESGEVISASVPRTVHQEQAMRTLQQSATEDRRQQAIDEITSAPSDASKRKAPPAAPPAVAVDSASKRVRRDDGTGGPARANDLAKDRAKQQRLKGQSGIESGWKSEEWMKMRQNFDG